MMKTMNQEIENSLAQQTATPQLRVDNVSIRYGDRYAIENASFNARSGEVLALVGPSGCGKSSLLSSINRMTDSLANCQVTGDIYLDAINIRDASYSTQALRRRVAMVFQQANPFPMSITENICFPLKDHGMRDAEQRQQLMRQVLTQTGLWNEVKDRLKQNALSLSGGQQQRLCIARALALQPQVILFDEPCSALDPLSTETIETLIADLKGTVTMILVTHNLAQARRIADQVAVCWVDKGCGCVVECDETKTIFESPVHPVTKDYCLGRLG